MEIEVKKLQAFMNPYGDIYGPAEYENWLRAQWS
jgi:hypothetical protein